MKLVRVPAVFTVVAQASAAFLVAAGSAQPLARLLTVVIASVSLYWSGMIFNDLWDIKEDQRERPSRPLPSGEVSIFAAKLAGWGLMGFGVLLATLSGFIPSADAAGTLCPAIIGIALAICILLYNGPTKQTVLAPAMMGLCRAFCFLLGASPLVMVSAANLADVAIWFPGHIVAAAVGVGIYVMGITAISRSETDGGNVGEIVIGVVTMAAGAICLALAPRFAPAGTQWAIAMNERFPLLIALVSFSVIYRGIRIALRPEVLAIQNLIRVAIMTLIPIAAAFAVLAAGPIAGAAVFALVVPAIWFALKFRVT